MSHPEDVSRTLDALERKLRELESELGAAPPPAPPPPPGSPPPAPPPAGGLDELARQIDDLGRFREQLVRIGRELEDEYAKVLSRIESGATPPAPAAATAPAAAEAVPVAVPEAEPEPPGTLTVDAGPFADLDALGAFEQALTGIAGVEEAQVTGFEGRRALVDVRLGAPVALEVELRAALPAAVVRAVSEPGRLVLDLEAG
jgi:hypothetical protein